MGRIIINNKSKWLTDDKALYYVGLVMEEGLVSNDGKSYCYSTGFVRAGIQVSAKNNKESHTFTVLDRD